MSVNVHFGKVQIEEEIGNNEYAIRLKDLKIVKERSGKTEKDPVKPDNFEPVHPSFDASSMRKKLRRGLQEVYPHFVALQFLPKPPDPEIPEAIVAKHIADEHNIDRYETVDNIRVYTMKEYSHIFKCENGIGSEELCFDGAAQLFMDFLLIEEKPCVAICAKNCSSEQQPVLDRSASWSHNGL